MILSDAAIRMALVRGQLVIEAEGFDRERQIQPASVDCRLGNKFLRFQHTNKPFIDPANPDTFEGHTSGEYVLPGETFVLHPGDFVLGHTMEAISLVCGKGDCDLVARVDGRSSLGRLGLIVHSTAGFIDAGWEDGQITLEITNIGTIPIVLRPGMRVCQLSFEECYPVSLPYGHPARKSKYQHQSGVQASRLWRDE